MPDRSIMLERMRGGIKCWKETKAGIAREASQGEEFLITRVHGQW